MEIVQRETLTPAEADMPRLEYSDSVVLLFGLRCRRGHVGTLRVPVPREALSDAAAMVYLEETALDYARAHVCLRKAVVSDLHWCWHCTFAGVVNRHGMLRQHLRYVRTGDTWDGGVDVERCPAMSVGRKVT